MKLLVSDFDSSFYTDDINIIKNVEELNKFKNNSCYFSLHYVYNFIYWEYF